jgi:UDP-N-acetylglucosamine/UDP-N-acetylgalactosamine diphosphorylase
MTTYQQLFDKFTAAGQSQVFDFYSSLSDDGKANLLKNLATIDVDRCNDIFKLSQNPSTSAAAIAPLPETSFDSIIAGGDKIERWTVDGLKLIAAGKIAVILLAGGQGTRLGSSEPKGCYDIQLPSHKSLFQLQGERIMRLQEV